MDVDHNKSQKVWSKKWEILLLTCVILAVCALFTIPTIFYALPPFSLIKVPEDFESNRSSLNQCDNWKNYTGEICLDHLAKLQSCYASQVDVHVPVRIPHDTNQGEAESTATRLLHGLPLLFPSPECEAAITPFLCLYLFGSCDTDNQSQRVTQAECKKMRDDVCAREWALAERFLGEGVLPECGALYNQEGVSPKDECQGLNGSMLSVNQNRGDQIQSTDLQFSTNITCAEGYYLSESGVCRPLCSLWVEPQHIDSSYVAVIAAVVIGVLSLAVALVVVVVQRKSMLTFPTYYLTYLCITAIILVLLFLIGLSSKGRLFCTSHDLLETFTNPSAYCTFSGIVFMYGMAQLGLFVLCHAVGLCWGIVFPFHFRQFKAKEKLKYIHITTVLTVLLLPLVPALLHLKSGYGIADSPTIICQGRSIDVTFFTFILPMSAILAVATSVLVIMFWKIFKLVLSKLSTTVKSETAGLKKAEAKILFIMCYYILTGTLVLMLFTYFEATSSVEFYAVEKYFVCRSTGLQSGKDCGDTPQIHLTAFRSLSALAIVLIGLLPMVVITFTVMIKCERHKQTAVKV